ncbi:MAG TPA: O-antigen ligase family protein [Verrucomicrobiae bacterium]|nr:O-antigen ligase family protein [Verrucomicrobiae bacterium]
MRPLLERLGEYFPAALALTLPTLFLPTAEDSFILPRASIVIAGACLGASLALLAPGRPPLGSLRWPLYAAAAAAILAFVFSVSWPLSFVGSYTRYESLPIRLAYLGLLAGAAWLLWEKRHRDWVVAALVFGTAVACIEALQQLLGDVPYRPDGNLGNANLLGALIAMAVPLALSRAWRGGSFVLAWSLGIAVMAGGLVASTSRSGGLGALTGCLLLLVFALRGRLATAAVVGSAAAIAAALLLIFLSPLRFLNDDPELLRIHLWQDALRMISARPLTGWGEDATGLVFGHFLTGDWSPGVTFDRVHSGPLDIAATQGLLGLAAIGWILALLVRGAWRWRATGNVGALAAACAGYTVWVLFNFDWAPATGVFWLLAGTLWAEIRAADRQAAGSTLAAAETSPRATIWQPATAIALVFATIALAVLPLLADTWYLRGRVELSVQADPLQSRYHWALGQLLVTQGSVAQGVEEMKRAAELGETEPGLYVELGDREAELGRSAEARKDYQRALQIDPFYAPASQRLAGAGG